MTGFQEIKKQILPLVKGMPLVVICFIGTLFLARKVVQYTPEKYSTMAKIRLDDQKFGVSNNNLFADFDIFSTENKVAAEIEILKSPLIIGAALDSINLRSSIYRVGKMRSTLLYDNAPFWVDFDQLPHHLLNKKLGIELRSDSTYTLTLEDQLIEGELNSKTQIGQGYINISQKKELKNSYLKFADQYEIILYDRHYLIDHIKKDLTIIDVDQGVAVLRVVMKDEHPVRAAAIVNAICNAYIYDYVSAKSNAANRTMDFIKEEMKKIEVQLSRAEDQIENYKAQKSIVNTTQQTETGLREISKLKLSLINLEMNEKAVLELEDYIRKGDYFEETAINFGFGDLLMTELVKKLKLWNDEKLDLLIRFTPEHEKVIAVNKKIAEIKVYIKEAILSNKKEIITKKKEIKKSLALLERQFDGLSTKEKHMTIMDREFQLQQSVFNFLSKKKVEASIAGSASISFHRIIQKAIAPSKPVSPNKTLIMFVSGILSLFLSIGFIYLRQFVSGKILTRSDIEKRSEIPVLGVIKRKGNLKDGLSLAKRIRLSDEKVACIGISSTLKGEGKSYVTQLLSESLTQLNHSVTTVSFTEEGGLIDYPSETREHFVFNRGILDGSSKTFKQFIKTLKKNHDFVLIDAPSSSMSIDSIRLMKLADMTLYVSRAKMTSLSYAAEADIISEEYKIKKLFHVLNGVHPASNYTGNWVGRRYADSKSKKGLSSIIKTYIRLYLK